MRRKLAALVIAAIVGSLSFSFSGPAFAQTIDKNGRCHAADGKLAKMEVCKPPEKTADAAKSCRDKTTKKFAKCDAPNTEPVPARTK